MSYRLPPLNALRAFEASARHLSFTRAADELCVTAGAVSQQVKILEARTGVKLFRRSSRGLVLTAAGESYLPSISNALLRTAAGKFLSTSLVTLPGLAGCREHRALLKLLSNARSDASPLEPRRAR